MFTTGEFSKIARVSRRLLRHYREIGLFIPSQSDTHSGYHYYSVHQLPELNRILALRDLGFSLEQIKRTISNNISNEELRGMLQMRKAEVERTLLDELQKIRLIESRLQILEQDKPGPEVVVKSIPIQHFFSAHFVCASPEHTFNIIHEANRLLLSQVGSNYFGEMITILHSDDFRIEGAKIEIGFLMLKATKLSPIELNNLGLTFKPRTLDAVETMATVVIYKQPDVWHIGTTAIGHWMEAQGYKMVGPQREIWHSPSTGLPDEPIVELQIPVQSQKTVSYRNTDSQIEIL